VVWVTLGFCLLLKGNISKKALLAIAVTMLGNVLIAWADLGTASGLVGDLMSLAAALLLAAYTIIGRVVRMKVSTTVYTYICYSACAVALVISCLVQGLDFAGYGLSPYVAGLLLAVFSTILGHSVFNWCLRYYTPSFVSASKLCIPITSAVFAFLAFNEIPTMLQVFGCFVILGGMCWYYKIESKENR
jgi:drug/metabolite transporter (DMT)-like permease